MASKSKEEKLRKILGGTYGGPSMSYEDGKFVIYIWTDAPVDMHELASGETLRELLENWEANNEK